MIGAWFLMGQLCLFSTVGTAIYNEPECEINTDCNDYLYCNGQEECFEGFCVKGIAPCAPNQTCHEISRSCITPFECEVHMDCDNGVFCDGQELCSLGQCRSGLKPCEDKQCDEQNRSCVETQTAQPTKCGSSAKTEATLYIMIVGLLLMFGSALRGRFLMVIVIAVLMVLANQSW